MAGTRRPLYQLSRTKACPSPISLTRPPFRNKSSPFCLFESPLTFFAVRTTSPARQSFPSFGAARHPCPRRRQLALFPTARQAPAQRSTNPRATFPTVRLFFRLSLRLSLACTHSQTARLCPALPGALLAPDRESPRPPLTLPA